VKSGDQYKNLTQKIAGESLVYPNERSNLFFWASILKSMFCGTEG
jgi:hypothetical protein